jgi:hypothetical protein
VHVGRRGQERPRVEPALGRFRSIWPIRRESAADSGADGGSARSAPRRHVACARGARIGARASPRGFPFTVARRLTRPRIARKGPTARACRPQCVCAAVEDLRISVPINLASAFGSGCRLRRLYRRASRGTREWQLPPASEAISRSVTVPIGLQRFQSLDNAGLAAVGALVLSGRRLSRRRVCPVLRAH